MKKVIIQKKELGNIQSSLDYFLKFKLPKTSKILDIGCNYGSLINHLFKKGYKNVYGIDINKEAINEGKKAYPPIKSRIIVYNGKKIPFKIESFDVVLMFDVIEHIPNIKGFMEQEVKRVLKPEGNLIFQTPNKWTNVPWEIIHQKSFTKWKNYHCSLQTNSSLKSLLKENFEETKIEKGEIITEHNLAKLSKKIGRFPAKSSLWLLDKFPLSISTNFWGYARR